MAKIKLSEPRRQGDNISSDLALMRIQLADASTRNATLLQEQGAIRRAFVGWIEATNPALWNAIRQRTGETPAIIAILDQVKMNRSGRAISSDSFTHFLEALRDVRPSLAKLVSNSGYTLDEILLAWETALTSHAETIQSHSAEPESVMTIAPVVSDGLAPIPSTTSPPQSITPDANELSEFEKIVIINIGEGYFLDRQIVPEQESEIRRFAEAVARLVAADLVRVFDLDLGVSRASLKFCEGLKALCLTLKGELVYTSLTGKQPRIRQITALREDSPTRVPEGWAKAIGHYASLESYVLVRATKAAIINAAQNNDGIYPPKWHVKVFDMMDPSDQAAIGLDDEYAATLAKMGRGFQTRWKNSDGKESIPDLIILMKPANGGVPTIMLVEVERAKYSKQAMIEKLRRNVILYPPYPFCYVFPTDALMGQIFGVFKDNVVDPELKMNGLPNGVKALFTSFHKITNGRWWSVEQASKAAAASKAGKGKGEDINLMPKFWMESAKNRPFLEAKKHATDS